MTTVVSNDMDNTCTSVNHNAAIYYADSYWNNYPIVQDRIIERLSGAADTPWFLHFHRKIGGGASSTKP